MSTFRGSEGEPGQRAVRPTRRRPRWVVTGGIVAGSLVVGAAGLAGVASAAGLSAPDLGRLSALMSSDGGSPAPDGKAPHGERPGDKGPHGERPDGGKGPGHDGDPDRAIPVPCDAADLVAALVKANAEGGAHLRLAPKCTYTLKRSETSGEKRDPIVVGKLSDRTGLPVIYQPVTIHGEGATIARDKRAKEEFRFFTVRNGGELVLKDVTLENGTAGVGGAIHTEHGANAVVERVTVTHSTARDPDLGGGAIFNDGHMVVKDSKFVENQATGHNGRGGGILNGGVFTLDQGRFMDNRARGYGGGLANYQGAADVSNSTFANNRARQGGGLASFAARTKVWDTKIVGNSATIGGGAANGDATLTMRGMTIQHNTASVDGGGVSASQGLLTLDDSAVEDNRAHGDGGGVYAVKTNLLVRDTSVSGNQAVVTRSQGGGIAVGQGQLALFKSEVVDNRSERKPGGVFVKYARATVDGQTEIKNNDPTNCLGSPTSVPNCFG
ncbi:hypothetical protein [Plantactinospora sp. GCM10030261]|uniref:hypothetical protein n=1 Tax=Plantactinospora sp. GCM10030261 TaxID=3273420 RepID=UPI00362359A4